MIRPSRNPIVSGAIIWVTLALPTDLSSEKSPTGKRSAARAKNEGKKLEISIIIIMMNRMHKTLITTLAFVTLLIPLGGCSTNPATGKQQFTALMSPKQENQVGASEHQKIAAQFGLFESPKVTAYVNEIGRKIVPHTERADVQYKFYVLDSPIVNAFALPGGYVYLSRGLLALANNEAEVAAVVAHEIGHITGRHSAERYSHSAVTALGANVASILIDGGQSVNQALGLGTNLYLSSYSRSQETEADSLGLRYMTKAGYNAEGMPKFLSALHANSALSAQEKGKKPQSGPNYLSTHPATADRVNATNSAAKGYGSSGAVNRDRHFNAISGMTYGDSAKQGFVKGDTFFHPELGFAFDFPAKYKIINQPSQVIASPQDGSNSAEAIIFDMASNKGKLDAATYLQQVWMEGDSKVNNLETITVNGMRGATAMFSGRVNGRAATIRIMAIEFKPDQFARFQIAIPQDASKQTIDDLKRASYSFRKLSARERTALKPQRIQIITARPGDTVQSISSKMPFKDLKAERFLTLNALIPGEALKAGQKYKTIVQ